MITDMVFCYNKYIGPQEIQFILVYFYAMQLDNIKLPLVPLLYFLYLLHECP